MVVQRELTTEDFEMFLAKNADLANRFELIFGEIYEKMPTQLHAYIIALLTAALINFLEANPLGWALVEARYRIPGDEHNDRIPDLSFVRNVRGVLVKEGPAPYMPDLAVEVQSPGQSDKLMSDKAQYYLANGSHMVWLIYPEKRLVEVLTKDDRQLLTPPKKLSAGELLPNFEFDIARLFVEV